MSRGPRITQQQRDEWLGLYEEGEPISKIASDASADPRTVKIHIELAQREKKREQIFFTASLNAVEAHFRDIIKFVKKMDKAFDSDRHVSSSIADDPMWFSLKKHIPKSSIWRNLRTRESIINDISKLEPTVYDNIRKLIEKRIPIPFTIDIDSEGLSDGMIQGLLIHFKKKAKGQSGFTVADSVRVETVSDRVTLMWLGAYSIGLIPNQQVEEIKNIVTELLNEVVDFPEFEPVKKLYNDLERIKHLLHEEFQTILLRRVVPGRCKYCPL